MLRELLVVNSSVELIRRYARGDQSLVVVDGIAVSGGIERLSEVAVEEAIAVNLLQPRDATARYGSRAADGAIEVVTKNRATACRRAFGPR